MPGPQVSDNDLTVVFRRTSAFIARQVKRPKPAPRPPLAPRKPAREPPHPTPLAMTVPPQRPIETVVLEPGPRVRAVLIAVLVTFGCVLGVGVEMLARPAATGSSARGRAPARATTASTVASPLDVGHAGVERTDDRGAPHAPHHHVHRAATAGSATAAAAQLSHTVDAGADTDDFAAAADMLTKAKAVETLP
jgi:hypothetical protein